MGGRSLIMEARVDIRIAARQPAVDASLPSEGTHLHDQRGFSRAGADLGTLEGCPTE